MQRFSDLKRISESGRSEFKKAVGSGIVYIFCDEIDRYFEQIETKGARPNGAKLRQFRKVCFIPKDGPRSPSGALQIDALKGQTKPAQGNAL